MDANRIQDQSKELVDKLLSADPYVLLPYLPLYRSDHLYLPLFLLYRIV